MSKQDKLAELEAAYYATDAAFKAAYEALLAAWVAARKAYDTARDAATTYTFSSVSLGTAATARKIFIGVAGRTSVIIEFVE